MNFEDYVLFAAVSANDTDVPDQLWPTTIFDNAAMMAHLSPDSVGTQAWI